MNKNIYFQHRYDLGPEGVEVHVDALPIELRSKLPQGGCVSHRAHLFTRVECKVHTEAKCRCHLPIHLMGQDESIY